MLLGADLGHVICDPDAGTVIKTYSPDIIVHRILTPNYDEDSLKEELKGLLSRLHTLVVGPGLGREEYMQKAAKMAITIAKEQEMFIVIDADGLWLVQNHPEIVQNYPRAVLTPNVVEFGRICEKLGIDQKEDVDNLAKQVASKLGHVTVVQKGATDVISNGYEVLKCEEEGGLKRTGGQGDVLSGTIGTFLAWAKNYEAGVGRDENPIQVERMPILAALGGATVTRTCSKLAFKKVGRAMQTSDVIKEVGPSYEYHFGVISDQGHKL